MAKVKAKLRDLNLKGERVHTRWGHVQFDKDGLAELEVDEDDLPLLRDMKPHSWLAEDHTSYQAALKQADSKAELKAKADKVAARLADESTTKKTDKDDHVAESMKASEEGASEHGEPEAPELAAKAKGKKQG